MIVLVDNYDSFSYNLYQYVGSIDPDLRVVRNDALTVAELRALQPQRVILSPGPGWPKDAGICVELVRELGARVPVLGVCLGHQAICEAYGARIGHAAELMHGKQSHVSVDADTPLFSGLPQRIEVARYHSLSAQADTMPSCLRVTARADDGEVMAVQHERHPVFGVQFHPESIMTPDGMRILENFIRIQPTS